MSKRNYLELALAILLCNLAGFIGSVFTMPSIPTWYAALVKPAFNPPNWIFGPVWTLLYILMGIALYLVWQKRAGARAAIWLFLVHLVINALWSVVFFGWHEILWAFVVIILLWLMIVALIWMFYKVNKTAAYLLVPYLLWVSFASLLNYALWSLN